MIDGCKRSALSSPLTVERLRSRYIEPDPLLRSK